MARFRGLGGGGVLALVAAACGGGTSTVIAEGSGGSGVGAATPGSVTTTVPSMVAVPVRSVPDPLASLGLRDSDGCIVMAHSAAEIQGVLDSLAPDLAASTSVADLVARAKAGGVEAISGELAVLEEQFGKDGVESVMDGLLNSEPRVCEPTVTAGVDPEPVPRSMADDVRKQSSRPGYFGPFYRDRVVQSSLPSFEVLPRTVTTTNGVDGVTVRGIAVNNSSTSAGSPQVEIGGVAVGPAAVNMVLPGEPVPFEVTVPAIDQSQLSTLKVIGTPGPDNPPGRAFGIAIWWTLQRGVRERMKAAGM